jgi:hypothetical protein
LFGKALAYLQSAKINQEEQNFKQKFAEKYKLQAQFLIVGRVIN